MCEHKGKHYLVIVDYYSRWIEIKLLTSQTSLAVINAFKNVFACHGIPDEIQSDNGPQFQCNEFRTFAECYGFSCKTSSPYFPQANGEAESAVKIAKKILPKLLQI